MLPGKVIGVLVLAGLAAACGSGGDPAPSDCTVTCPQGTFCDRDRCVPICAPPCGPNQYCGADRICHAGKAPDGGVVVPPVDAGIKKDSGGTTRLDHGAKKDSGGTTKLDHGAKKDSGTTKLDHGIKPDTTDPKQVTCACLAKQPKQAHCVKQAVTCVKASDCCGQSSVPCGIYSNKYTCVGGKCARAGCQGAQECVTYAQSLQQPSPGNWTCHPGYCAGSLPYCAEKTKSCSQDKDCCNPSSVTPCGVYVNHYACTGGACTYLGCAQNAECVTYAQLIGAANPSSWICRTTACFNIGYCTFPQKPCSKPADCCTPNSSIPCGVYANRWRCESGECVLDWCKDKQDCLAYAGAVKLPDPNAYNCIEY